MIVSLDDIENAYELVKRIGAIRKEKRDLLREEETETLGRSLPLLQWVCLPMLGPSAAPDLVTGSLLAALRAGVDVESKIRAALATELIYEQRDVWKRKMREALLGNRESLSSFPVQTPIGPTRSAGQWVRYYFRETTEQSPVARAQFWTRREVGALSDGERSSFRSIVALFDYLGQSSLTPEGIEEVVSIRDEGGVRVLRRGAVETVHADQRLREIAKFLQERRTDTGLLDVHFLDRAERGALLRGTELSDEEWAYARAAAESAGEVERFEDQNRPKRFTAEDLAFVLRGWFEHREGKGAEEAKRAGLAVVNVLADAGYPEYLPTVYFDNETKTLRWREER